MVKKIFGVFVLVVVLKIQGFTQPGRSQWVDSVLSTMGEAEKIGQLFMMPVSSHLDEKKLDNLEKDLKDFRHGGVVFTTGHAVKQAALTNRIQGTSKIPLLVAQDASSGLGSLLDSTLTFPNALALGAISSDTMLYNLGLEIARELKLLGVNLNLAPNANLFDKNDPTFRTDVFGEDKKIITKKLLAYWGGMQAGGILACAKYFPVQGITITDVEKGLPVIHSFVDSVQAYPFQQLFSRGLTAVMPAANHLPVFYEKKKAARKNKFSGSVLSSFYAGDWMKKQMHFNGLVIVDIRILESASDKLRNGDAELFAFQAGNDILLTDNNPAPAIRKIRKLLKKETQYVEQLNKSVRKILEAKYDAHLVTVTTLDTDNLLLKLNSDEARVMQQHFFNAAVTVVRNNTKAIPVPSLENKKIASVIIGDTTGCSVFQSMIEKYVHVKKISITQPADSTRLDNIAAENDLIIAVFTTSTPKELLEKIAPLLKPRRQDQQLIAVDLGSKAFASFSEQFDNIITGFTSQPEMLRIIPQVIFGGLPSNGTLPIDVAGILRGNSVATRSINRFAYSIPEDAGLSGNTLSKISSIAKEAIAIGGTPGCHVLIAKEGKIVYEKSFGYLTYENQFPVTDSTLYDLASVTKVSATLQAVMFLYDRGLIDINKKASVYLPELKNSNKKDFTIKDILTHQAGLWPFLPFWAQTMKDTAYLQPYYQHKPSLAYPYMVADKLYANVSMRDSLWNWIIRAKIREKPARTPFDYKYSDMGFYIMQHLAERILNQPIEDFLEQNLYEPLGSYTTGYLPLMRFPVSRIAPTENDKLFRKSLLIGTVHDQGAAMLGGVAGHAGLFSTANDLAKLGQMLLQEGQYGGYQYYKPETVRLFTHKQFETSRRGLGWDKPIQSDPVSPTSLYASPRTFGHTGFTGTCIWVDPEFNLVYIFLSNRVHPDMTNNKLLNANIRSRIQDVIYQSIFDYCRKQKPETPVHESVETSAAR
jgi:beta-N-acetylhexosaminidase